MVHRRATACQGIAGHHVAGDETTDTEPVRPSLIMTFVIDWKAPLRNARSQAVRPVITEVSEAVSTAVSAQVTQGVTEGVTADLTGRLRVEVVELTRMLRQQGDAADEVAEALGRTLARLSAEIESLATAVANLERRLADADGADEVRRPPTPA